MKFVKTILRILRLWASIFCIGIIKVKYKYRLNLEMAKRDSLFVTNFSVIDLFSANYIYYIKLMFENWYTEQVKLLRSTICLPLFLKMYSVGMNLPFCEMMRETRAGPVSYHSPATHWKVIKSPLAILSCKHSPHFSFKMV